ncbi:MAG: hypothetical protein M3340_06785 [Actinomycetota bacterium]|nr:hypothetical protein [Actinomycetota bacterium]
MSFSAAARTLVERGDRCTQCGGELELAAENPPVGVLADGESGSSGESGGRRFGGA